jgi:1-aminocyclopropane-1-carboxylate deaminase/D-cysteine desulfhydrase-like pyridoxal-dependent ACC family enzyme
MKCLFFFTWKLSVMFVVSFFIRTRIWNVAGFYNGLSALTRIRSARFSILSATPIHQTTVFGRNLYIKRDDLCRFNPDIGITGNKVRKLQGLYDLFPFPSTVLSYGGSQSNAMRALALLTESKESEFIYFTRTISKSLKEFPEGNYLDALNAGMKVSWYRPTCNFNFNSFSGDRGGK